MDERRRVIAMLDELARRAPADQTIPRRLRRRARLAMARSALVVIALLAVTAGGGVAAYHNLSEHRPGNRAVTQPEPRDVVAYVSDRDGDADIYTMALGEEGFTNLTDNDEADVSPSWSPDGSQIVFSSDRSGGWDLYVMNADGSDAHELLAGGSHPSWSPDGSAIAFERATTEPGSDLELSQIYTLDLTTGVVEQVTHDDAGALQAEWSPEGDEIAYAGRQARIVVADAAGSEAQRLTDEYLDMHPVWSPDGSSLLFSRETSFADDVSLSNVFTVDVAGQQAPRQITHVHDGSAVPSSFSPDGDRILVTIYDGDAGDVYLMDADGEHASPLVDGPADDGEAAWRPLP